MSGGAFRSGGTYNPTNVRTLAGQIDAGRQELALLGRTMPEHLDASVLSPVLAQIFETVAADLAALETGMAVEAERLREAARGYEHGDEVNAAEIAYTEALVAELDEIQSWTRDR